MVGNIVTGTVRRRERGDIYIDLGKAEALLPSKEQVPARNTNPATAFAACAQHRQHARAAPKSFSAAAARNSCAAFSNLRLPKLPMPQ